MRFDRYAVALVAAAALWPMTARAGVEVLWYASRSAEAKTNWLYGDDTCDPGDRACNPCTSHVELYISSGLSSEGGPPWLLANPLSGLRKWIPALDRDNDSWTYVPGCNYDPNGICTENVYEETFAHHPQGFVHANPDSTLDVFVMSHSGNGSISVIRNSQLEYLYETGAEHPSSLFSIGHYAGFVNGSTHDLNLLDLDDPNYPIDVRYEMPGTDPDGRGLGTGGGGVSMARLRGGGHLLAVAQDDLDARVDFFFIDGDINSPARKEFLGEAVSIESNHLSLITECSTGTIYAVLADGEGGLNLGGYGWWVLARLDWGDDGPELHFLASRFVEQDSQACYPRGGASASVLSDGNLELVALERNAPLAEFDHDWDYCALSSSVLVSGF